MNLRIMEIKNQVKVLVCLWLTIGTANVLWAAGNSSSNDGESYAHSLSAPVGSLGLVLGRAYLQREGVSRQRLRAGDLLHQSDTVVTESNGHAHITFVDNAMVSVRPNSRLEIVEYKFDEINPENSIVKFNLLQGTARAVSGQAAEAAKDRFRLNTPVAAIGVRGTDFVVVTDSTSVRAMVNEGSIVVAPFSTECSVAGSGPCSANAVELDGGSTQIIEFDSSLVIPRVIQLSASRQNQETLLSPLARASSQVLQTEPPEGGEADSLPTEQVAGQSDALPGRAGTGANQVDALADSVSSVAGVTDVVSEGITSLDLSSEAKEKAPYQTGYTPSLKIESSDARQRQLVWGRYAEGRGQLERITLPFGEASVAREVTIGGNFEYYLFRAEGSQISIAENQGRVGFTLDSAQAYYDDGADLTAVAISSGNLVVDFEQNLYDTHLNLHHLELGKAIFQSAGRLRDGGYFSSYASDGSESLAGALSLDGREAGYFFDFRSWQGGVQGITLWDASR